jgi:hypothetical protein
MLIGRVYFLIGNRNKANSSNHLQIGYTIIQFDHVNSFTIEYTNEWYADCVS